jgi:adenine-specific DNA-methyltransferase
MKEEKPAKLLKEIELLREEIEKYKKLQDNGFGMVWENKPEDVVEECKSKIPVLEEVSSRRIITNPEKPINLVIEGDNYHSLSVLNYTHREKVDLIYIDPPYNTGTKDFRYNDQFVEKDDQWRHSKWLSFMAKRLKLSRNLLKLSGAIFISIDENELAQLKLLCDEIFGEANFESIISWRRRSNQPNDKAKMVAKVSEFLLVYAKNSAELKEKKLFNTLSLSEKRVEAYSNPDNDSRGAWSTTPWCASRGQGGTKYEIVTPTNIKYNETWLGTKETFNKYLQDNRIVFTNNGDGKPRKKVFLKERQAEGQSAVNFWVGTEYGDNLAASAELNDIFAGERVFDNPKPINLIKTILKLKTQKNDLVLDFFAGSGTTGHAVMSLNSEDGGSRSYILCTNNENEISTAVCYPRIEKIIVGYKNLKGENVPGLGGNLLYQKTAFIDSEKISEVSDRTKIRLTHKVGQMIAVRENTLFEQGKNEQWQIFSDGLKKKWVGIYFKEDKEKLPELVDLLSKKDKAVIYVFGWGKSEYKNAYPEYKNIRLEDIPEPILEVYKELNKLI